LFHQNNATLMQQVFHVPQGQWKSDVEHHRQADDIGAGLEVAAGETLGHSGRLADRPALRQAWLF
jgi:hypothetical protein